MELALLGAAEAVKAIRDGLISSEDLVKECLEQIDRLEEQVQAWAFLEPEFALEQSREAVLAMCVFINLGRLH
ncbi:MAG: amidase, partial [Deltaproteobacteria bacterium]|nr:amidase [Deltaproteobacteria bacterium]